MAFYYLDIETNTEGRKKTNPQKDKIVTIQYQKFDPLTGESTGELVILKAWERSEKEILKEFIEITKWEKWNYNYFIPVGVKIAYEFIVISTRARKLLKKFISVNFLTFKLSSVDLAGSLFFANKGRFNGSGLHEFSSKKASGKLARDYIQRKEWVNLEGYINEETVGFFEVYTRLMRILPLLKEENKENGLT